MQTFFQVLGFIFAVIIVMIVLAVIFVWIDETRDRIVNYTQARHLEERITQLQRENDELRAHIKNTPNFDKEQSL